MAFTSFEEFEKAFNAAADTGEIPAGDFGTFNVREPSAIDFEPVQKRRRDLIEASRLDFDDPADMAYIPAEIKEKDRSEWPEFSYAKFSDDELQRWHTCSAELIVMSVTNGNGQLLFKDKLDHVLSWPGALLTQVSDDIVSFVRGEDTTEKKTTTK